MSAKLTLMIGELEVGGTQRQMLELASRVDRQLFEPEVVCLSNVLTFAAEFERAGVPVRVVLKRSRYDTSILRRLYRYFQTKGTAAVMTFGFTADAWGRVAAKLARVPVVVSSVRTSHEDSRLLETVNRCLASLADHYIVNSEAAAEHLRRYTRVAHNAISTIPNGLDLDRFIQAPGERARTRAELGIPEDEIVVGVVSRVSVEKNVEMFIRVARLVLERMKAGFIIVGDGPERCRLQRMTQDLDRVHWLGERSDIPRWLSAFDIAMLSSDREGISNAVLEYMAAGLPVVASAAGGTPEVVVDGTTGLLFRPGDETAAVSAVLTLANDHSLRRTMGDAGRQHVENHFSMDAMVHATESLLLRLLERSGRYVKVNASGSASTTTVNVITRSSDLTPAQKD